MSSRSPQCGAASGAAPNRCLCAACGNHHTGLLSSDEPLLAQVELAIPTPDPELGPNAVEGVALGPANSLH